LTPADIGPARARREIQARGLELGTTAFFDQVAGGEAAVVGLFLDAGMDPDTTLRGGVTALILAAGNGRLDVVRLLLERGADPRRHAHDGASPLFTYLVMQLRERVGRTELPSDEDERIWLELTRALASAGADLNANVDRQTPLSAAVLLRSEPLVAELLRQGATPDAGHDALVHAAGFAQGAILSRLLRAGGDPHALDPEGRPLLFHAVDEGNLEAVDALLAAGEDPSQRWANDETPLLRAAFRGHEALARRLLDAGADIHAKSRHGHSAVSIAYVNRRLDLARLLLERGAPAKPWLGLVLKPSGGNAPGVEVSGVARYGPAEDARLQRGDRLVAIDGHPLGTEEERRTALALLRPLEPARLHVVRGGEPLIVDLQVGVTPGAFVLAD